MTFALERFAPTRARRFGSLAFAALPLSVAVACGGGGKKPETPASGGVAATGGSGSSGSVNGGTGASTKEPCPAPVDLGVRFVGRSDGCDPAGVRYAWSGSGFVGAFRGTGLKVRLKEKPNQHTVLIDGKLGPKLVTTDGEAWYTLATGLSSGEHRVEMYRRTEASFGTTLVEAFEVEGGELLAPPAPAERRIEVIGDSITCGYGNEGALPCPFSAETENHYLAYGALLARSLGAEASTVAWSGKGVIYNYGGDRVSPMPVLYPRVDPDDRAHPYDFKFQPQLVLINLGTNDYSSGHDPTDELFVTTYRTFLETLRAAYPNAFILCTVGPLLSGNMLATARRNIRTAVDARIAAGDTNVDTYELTTPNAEPVGCDWHPSLAVHAAMAAELEAPIKKKLGW